VATANVKVSINVRDEASTTFLAYACHASIYSGAFDRFLVPIENALRYRRRISAREDVATKSDEGR
jgi:hypothetical protein